MLTRPMAQPTTMVAPTSRPILGFPTLIMPKCTGSMPNALMTGRKIGVQINGVGARSEQQGRMMPAMNRCAIETVPPATIE